jgi:hypothetical protein
MNTPKVRTMRRAADMLGGEPALAKALGVKPQEVAAWLSGECVASDRAYFLALDIVARGPEETGPAKH